MESTTLALTLNEQRALTALIEEAGLRGPCGPARLAQLTGLGAGYVRALLLSLVRKGVAKQDYQRGPYRPASFTVTPQGQETYRGDLTRIIVHPAATESQRSFAQKLLQAYPAEAGHRIWAALVSSSLITVTFTLSADGEVG